MNDLHDKTAEFYDTFNSRLLKDYIRGNKRVSEQRCFFFKTLRAEHKRILVVGCGLGDITANIAQRMKDSFVLGLDISPENISVAQKLFSLPNLEYRLCNVIDDDIEDNWDIAFFPDVYEHIPKHLREKLHQRLGGIINSSARCVLTCPTLSQQDFLRRKGEGLQIIDEDVSVSDLCDFAQDVGGELTYYTRKSIFRKGDYLHAIIDRDKTLATSSNLSLHCTKDRFLKRWMRLVFKIKSYRRSKLAKRSLKV